jgi:ATP-dependent RNA helicase DDX52/ROK1
VGQKRKLKSGDLGDRKKRRKAEGESEAEDEGKDEDYTDDSIVEAEEQPVARQHQVKTKGSNVPPHLGTFDDLRIRYSFPSHIASNLEKYGYSKPTSVQSYVIPILLEVRLWIFAIIPGSLWIQNRDVAAISPTGTGKTLSYLLPIMIALDSPISNEKKAFGSGVRAVVLAPTRELAHQIHNECLKLAEGRKWRIVLFSRATASTLAEKSARDRVGEWKGSVSWPCASQ